MGTIFLAYQGCELVNYEVGVVKYFRSHKGQLVEYSIQSYLLMFGQYW